ncbi:hypothetical protein C0033_24790 [Clostridium sp. chh4-2]|nr:hypothetical protein C0033_24790 [Clostridium sp. chh4-2]
MREFIIDYLQREYTLPDGIELDTFNYIESGYVDSFGLIQFIATIEDEYNIEFTDEDLQNPELKTVGGLIKIMESKQ